VAASVCRISGKLPNGGCDSVEVVNRDGLTETRSMIYTEYFVKGTQPTDLCPLHPSPSFMDRIAGLFGAGTSKPVPPEDLGLPRGQTGTAGVHQPQAQVPDAHREEPPKDTGKAEEPPKKRGFWARVFGKDGKKQDSKKKGGGG
jgi:hypothetical protein